MANPSNQTQSKPTGPYRIVVHSIGTAKPAACAAIAKGLGLSVSHVVARLYRAPAVLVDGIDQAAAQQMAGLLKEIGYQAAAQPMHQAAPAASPLHDVAVYLEAPDQLQPVAKSIAAFVGVAENDALQMLLTPPGVVLGSVSQATVSAFSKQLGDGVSVISSVAATADYDLFLGNAPDIVLRRITADLRDNNIPVIADTGLVATGVTHATARALWRRHQASGALRIVNREFLRFDLICEQIAAGCEVATQQQKSVLESIAGIPSDITGQVLQALPLTLMEAVPNNVVEANMQALAEVGLVMRADLVTFQMLGLEILSTTDPTATRNTLARHGLLQPNGTLPRTPFTLESRLPELYAKIVKFDLQRSGAEVDFMAINA